MLLDSSDEWLLRVDAAVRRVLGGRDSLLRPEVRRARPRGAPPMWGHCYVAAEATYYLAAARLGFRPWSVRLPDRFRAPFVHWFLANGSDLPGGIAVVDPSRTQFPFKALQPSRYDYAAGRPRPFLTSYPSARAREAMALAMSELLRPDP